MVKIIIALTAIQHFIFLFTIKDKSVGLRLLAGTTACTHSSIAVVKPTACTHSSIAVVKPTACAHSSIAVVEPTLT